MDSGSVGVRLGAAPSAGSPCFSPNQQALSGAHISPAPFLAQGVGDRCSAKGYGVNVRTPSPRRLLMGTKCPSQPRRSLLRSLRRRSTVKRLPVRLLPCRQGGNRKNINRTVPLALSKAPGSGRRLVVESRGLLGILPRIQGRAVLCFATVTADNGNKAGNDRPQCPPVSELIKEVVI